MSGDNDHKNMHLLPLDYSNLGHSAFTHINTQNDAMLDRWRQL